MKERGKSVSEKSYITVNIPPLYVGREGGGDDCEYYVRE